MWQRFLNLDPRTIYGLLIVAILIPFFTNMTVPVEVMPLTKQAFDVIQSLPAGAKVVISYDYGFGTQPEHDPILVALLGHLARRDARVYAVASVADGPMLAEGTLRTYDSLGKRYGTDMVNLGFFAGGEAGLAALCKDVRSVYRTDLRGTRVDDIPMMKDIKTMNDFDLIISANSGPTGGALVDVWIRQTVVPYKSKLLIGLSAIMVPQAMPYIQSKQVVGLVGGLRGGAEYEMLAGSPGDATRAMGAQSSTHLLVLTLILLGNIGSWITRRGKGIERGAERVN